MAHASTTSITVVLASSTFAALVLLRLPSIASFFRGTIAYLQTDAKATNAQTAESSQPSTGNVTARGSIEVPDIEDIGLSPSCILSETSRPEASMQASLGSGVSIFSNGVRQIHLEITDKCNAACPQCARNRSGGETNPRLPLVELSLKTVMEMLRPKDFAAIRKVFLCGNYGDPCSARECLEIVRYLRAANPVVGVHTNGGARSARWWAAAGRVLESPSYVRFGIDGLEDTNHLYRQRVSWKALMRNVEAFIAAGGNAEWDFLVFRHNQHQVEQARALSKAMGFSRFQLKKTQRFLNWKTGELRDSTPVHNNHGEVVRHLELPTDAAMVNHAIASEILQKVERFGSMDAYYDQCSIRCKASTDKEVYISAEGYALPCCWLAGHVYNDMADRDRELLRMLGRIGLTLADLKLGPKNTLDDVINNRLFAEALPASFTQGAGKMRTCAKACGSDENAFRAQFC